VRVADHTCRRWHCRSIRWSPKDGHLATIASPERGPGRAISRRWEQLGL